MTWIATRTLTDDAGGQVTVSLGAPQEVGPEEWRCAYEVAHGGAARPGFAHGIDGIQALVLAFDALYRLLEQHGAPLTMAHGQPGDTGIPRLPPMAWGLPFQRHVEDLMKREEAFWNEALAGFVARFAGHPRPPADIPPVTRTGPAPTPVDPARCLERRLHRVGADGLTSELVVRIGLPDRIEGEPGQWRCPCEVIGGDRPLPDVIGDSAVQVMGWAVKRTSSLIERMIAAGDRIYLEAERTTEVDATLLRLALGA